ncbi:hypothetical protein ABZ760_17005 [Streptomyces sp. NPDC006658]|uniref:hypothetical protein n=1 Tax=Streptomyces sp. NPDC006658 TaxID=3156900 RepID=UPI00340ACA7F
MRLCTSLSLFLTAAAATAVTSTAVPLPARAAQAPAAQARALAASSSCAGTDARTFPLAARIRGGPVSYEAGGAPGTWYLDLTNTTDRTCAGVHPVVVLVDEKRALRPDQPRLDFYDGSRARPVAFEATDAEELVGVLDGPGFAGFTVPAGRTVSVRIRFSLAPGAVTDEVTVNAAVVQRRGQDGDWIGESNAYRFGIAGDTEADAEDAEHPEEDPEEVQEARATPPSGTPRPTHDTVHPVAVPTTTGPSRPRPESLPARLTRIAAGLTHAPLAVLVPLFLLLAAVTGAFLLFRDRR